MQTVRIGFMPLIDCAVIAVACERGLAERRGFRLVPSREPSWAAIRDHVAFGMLEAAHMLAPMPAAMTLGLGGPQIPMIAPLSLGRGGNAITVSEPLYAAMEAVDPAALTGPRALSARALARLVAERRGAARMRFAAVFPFSCHYYELRLWLAAGGVNPDRDVELVVIPPPRMVENLASGLVDGFCVGEPWNQHAVTQGLGRIVATKADIAPEAPEKVLGLRRLWSLENADIVTRLTEALVEAAAWADSHPAAVADLLAKEAWVGVPASLLLPCLEGTPRFGPQASLTPFPGYQGFCDGPTNVPRQEQVEWLIGQMILCGQCRDTAGETIRRIFTPV
ncbi:MAG: Nitrate ABC transporter nitrate-binding protein [Rhodospirillaceae bacterium]|nr:MAG: Nitrate ABC transporter nitrate-binding protein [Rhodospirillaceae bacterium]